MKHNVRLLIVDDDADVRKAARLLLKKHFHSITCISEPSAIFSHIENSDIILLDMNFQAGRHSGEEGLHWLKRIHTQSPDIIIILMTAYGSVETAVNAMRDGATDFVLKPWQNEKLLATLAAATELSATKRDLQQLKHIHHELQPSHSSNIVAESKAMQRALKLVDKIASTDANVLILGENGVGKDVIAQEIYRRSSRGQSPLLKVDLGAVSESLFESELFGHQKGAFTGATHDRAGRFQAASGGTLFLDELGNLPLHLQAKLLRAIEQKEITPVGSDKNITVDVRLLAATNTNLLKMVEEGRFRADLLYRINTVQIEIPPLRERLDDIEPLAHLFIDKISRKYQQPQRSLSVNAVQALRQYNWPGNIRELAHTIERAVLISNESTLTEECFAFQAHCPDSTPHGDNNLNLDHVEKMTIQQALRKHQGNVSQAAKTLGLTRTALYRRLDKYAL